MRRDWLLRLFIVVGWIAMLGGCAEQERKRIAIDVVGKDGQSLDWTKTAALKVSKNCAEAKAFLYGAAVTNMRMRLEQNRREHKMDYYWMDGADTMESGSTGSDGDVQANAAPSSSAGGAKSYSDTNVQVKGVDEADLVKTNGDFIYTLVQDELSVVKAWPADQTHETGRVALRGSPSRLFLYGETLIALGHTYISNFVEDNWGYDGEDADWAWESATFVSVIDVSQPTAPRVVAEHLFEGNSISSRRIAGDIHLVQSDDAIVDGLTYWADVSYDAPTAVIDLAYANLVAKNTEILQSMDLTQWLPRHYELTGKEFITVNDGQVLTACDSVHIPTAHAGDGVLSVVTFSVDQNKVVGSSSVLGRWGTVYASAKAIYIAATNNDYYWLWDDEGTQPEINTHIHKFAISADTGAVQYAASGSAPGYVNDQFSLDEYKDHLRVATTDGILWAPEGDQSESFVTVFKESMTALKQVGQVGKLGLGERIYSVRFMGDKGYVVTFRETDPLYVLDLSNPAAPRSVGELKIPGFSTYMHPIDEQHLLTIGRDATNEGWVEGLALQIFDVSDPARPALRHKKVLGSDWGTASDAEYDHHAFVYFAAKGKLAIPVSSWGADNYWGYQSALHLFNIDVEQGIDTAGTVSHQAIVYESESDSFCGDISWLSDVKRGVFIEDYLYSVSSMGLRVHVTDNIEAGALVDLPLFTSEQQEAYEDSYGYCGYYDDYYAEG